MDISEYIPKEILDFLLVSVFSLLIGLEQRRHHKDKNTDFLFGTDRTFTFIGMLGYVLFITGTALYLPFIAGFLILGGLLAIDYYFKIKNQLKYGLTTVILALLTYCLPVIVITQPLWLSLMFSVTLLVITELKENFITLSKKISGDEFITLAKFIVFAGIILPLLPHTDISPLIKVSPYQIWLAIVVVSGISYGSYLLKKFVFPNSGVLFSAVLGGLYSSTATNIIIARKTRKNIPDKQAVSALFLATGMMYLRILILAVLFDAQIALRLFPPFFSLFVITLLLAVFGGEIRLKNNSENRSLDTETASKNPLEFKTAFIFGILFVIFGGLTHYVTEEYGTMGIYTLSYITGITDIDPLLLNLLQQKSDISTSLATLAIINATNSNNILKMIATVTVGSTTVRKRILITYGILIVAGFLISAVYYF